MNRERFLSHEQDEKAHLERYALRAINNRAVRGILIQSLVNPLAGDTDIEKNNANIVAVLAPILEKEFPDFAPPQKPEESTGQYLMDRVLSYLPLAKAILDAYLQENKI